MSLFKKYLKLAEETEPMKPDTDEKENKKTETEAMTDEDNILTGDLTPEDKEDEAPNPVLEEVADAVEEAMDVLVQEVAEAMTKEDSRPEVNAMIINMLRNSGVLINNPYKDLKPAKFTKAELLFMKKMVSATKNSVEDILYRAGKALKQRNLSKREASLLDRRLLQNGYLRSSIANPIPVNPDLKPKSKAVVELSMSKTRKSDKVTKSNLLGL